MCDAGPRAGLRVLVVDDYADTAESTALLLGAWGHQARVAHDGPDALTTAAAFQPDAALIDLHLPGMSGYEVAARLRQSSASARVLLVAVTGYGTEEARRMAAEAGFDLHLVKPVEPEHLQAVLAGIRGPWPELLACPPR